MDELSVTLLDRLIDKTFENMDQEERLAFIEKLFLDLPSADQQAFLLKLIQRRSGAESGLAGQYGPAPESVGSFSMHEMMAQGPPGFGPWQMCCRAMNDFVQAPRIEREEAAPIARIFNALADETRLKIVKLLTERECSVDELVQALGIAQSTTSHHLRVLKESGIIKGDKRGRSIYYSLAQPL